MSSWKQLDDATGGLSTASKMPGRSWSIPAENCHLGSILRKKEGSTCSTCYALKGNYRRYPAVATALARRLKRYNTDSTGWVSAMVESIVKTGDKYFRWFDSGDLQSVDMLADIVLVAQLTPSVNHWLPTRENTIVREYLAWAQGVIEESTLANVLPSNLTIRLSATMIGQVTKPATRGPLKSLPVSMVHKGKPAAGVSVCPASKQGGKCLNCRSCWDSSVSQVSYGAH